MDQKDSITLNKVLDGGMGRQIKKRGLPFKQPEWSAMILTEKPSALKEIHSDFIKNGAQIITTNTYAIVPFHIGDYRFKFQAAQLIETACQMAKLAKQAHCQKKIQIAFSVPPICGSYRPELFHENIKKAQQLYETFLQPALNLDYIDFFLCQTLSSIGEAKMLIDIFQKNDKPYCLSFTFDDETQELRWKGDKIEDLGSIIEDVRNKPLAVMINCVHVDTIVPIVKRLKNSLPEGIKIGCYPNNFEDIKRLNYNPKKDSFKLNEDFTAEEYQNHSKVWLQNGVDIIGGCCGIGPQYMQSIKNAFKHTE